MKIILSIAICFVIIFFSTARANEVAKPNTENMALNLNIDRPDDRQPTINISDLIALKKTADKQLYAKDGNDIIMSGSLKDFMQGDNGADTYWTGYSLVDSKFCI
ncbi:MAG: hypothetical protein AB7U85_04340 [Alphaproteobacteria bacterium]